MSTNNGSESTTSLTNHARFVKHRRDLRHLGRRPCQAHSFHPPPSPPRRCCVPSFFGRRIIFCRLPSSVRPRRTRTEVHVVGTTRDGDSHPFELGPRATEPASFARAELEPRSSRSLPVRSRNESVTDRVVVTSRDRAERP